jgi:hypothetical protein
VGFGAAVGDEADEGEVGEEAEEAEEAEGKGKGNGAGGVPKSSGVQREAGKPPFSPYIVGYFLACADSVVHGARAVRLSGTLATLLTSVPNDSGRFAALAALLLDEAYLRENYGPTLSIAQRCALLAGAADATAQRSEFASTRFLRSGEIPWWAQKTVLGRQYFIAEGRAVYTRRAGYACAFLSWIAQSCGFHVVAISVPVAVDESSQNTAGGVEKDTTASSLATISLPKLASASVAITTGELERGGTGYLSEVSALRITGGAMDLPRRALNMNVSLVRTKVALEMERKRRASMQWLSAPLTALGESESEGGRRRSGRRGERSDYLGLSDDAQRVVRASPHGVLMYAVSATLSSRARQPTAAATRGRFFLQGDWGEPVPLR